MQGKKKNHYQNFNSINKIYKRNRTCCGKKLTHDQRSEKQQQPFQVFHPYQYLL